MENTTVFIRYYDAEGWECIEAVPFFGLVGNSRLSYLLAMGGEIIPEYE